MTIQTESYALEAKASGYGVQFDGALVGPEYHDTVDNSYAYSLAEVAAEGGRISRFRVLQDGRYWSSPCDVSYVHATLADGRIVPVRVEVGGCYRSQLKGELIAWAKREGVYAKGIGLLDEGSWSVMYG
jgi:hypothetical protein